MPVSFRDVAAMMLLCNALWNALCGVSILAYMQCGWMRALADTHLRLWTEAEDRTNPAAMVLMAMLMFQWSFTRGLAGLDFDGHWADAAYSYWLEGALVGTCTLSGSMELGRGAGTVLLCFCCWELVVVTGMGQV